VVIQNEKYLMVDKSLATILFFKVLQLLQQLKVYLRPLVLQSFLFSLLSLLLPQERYTLFLSFLKDPLMIFLHGLTSPGASPPSFPTPYGAQSSCS
jgi:hypothetical protein